MRIMPRRDGLRVLLAAGLLAATVGAGVHVDAPAGTPQRLEPLGARSGGGEVAVIPTRILGGLGLAVRERTLARWPRPLAAGISIILLLMPAAAAWWLMVTPPRPQARAGAAPPAGPRAPPAFPQPV
jgi:hypothetical protein